MADKIVVTHSLNQVSWPVPAGLDSASNASLCARRIAACALLLSERIFFL